MNFINTLCFVLFLCLSVPANSSFWPEYDDFADDDEPTGTGDQEYFLGSNSNENVVILSVPNWDVHSNERNIDNTLDNEINPPPMPSENPILITLEVLAKTLEDLKDKVDDQESKIGKLEESYKSLEEKMDLIEQQTKTNNVIFFNIKEDKRESHKTTLQKILAIINRQMKVRVNVKDISVALRAEGNATDIRPVIVKFTNFDTKMKVLAVRNRLTRSKIVVVGDYSEKVAKKRVALLPYLQNARSQGYQAFILYDKLVVNGVKKSLEELQAEYFGREQQTQGTPVEQTENSEEDPKEQIEEVEVPPENLDDFIE